MTLRIALFSGNYNYVPDGCTRTLQRLVSFLERRKVEVLVFAPTVENPPCQAPGTVVSIPSIAVPSRPEYRLGLYLSSTAKKQLAQLRPSLIHIATPDILGYTALRLARARGIPVVASFHTRFDTYPRYYGLAWLEKYLTAYLRRFYQQCEHVYVPSESMANTLRAQGVGPNLRLWSRGVDRDLFHPKRRDLEWRRSLGFLDSDVIIAFVGRLVREKGLEAFARSLQQLRARDSRHRILIVGEGPEREWLSKKLPDAHFAGHLENEQLGRAYASADIFFNPSITETFGNVTLEAMAAGLPVLCADATGSRSIVVPDVTGFLVAPDQERGYVAALNSLVENEALRRRMGIASRDRTGAYDWDSILDGLLSQYLDVVDHHRTRHVRPGVNGAFAEAANA